ncbi:sodium-dependent neutral amino acid transporter B(0)AT2 isoform X1 [Tribolium castaneum]|uniref:sodium-dependent neutral amino acid transporter B(0)AT2 isoform X1 n=1 Tax=Tribolium castaneum TaxID=7070 RepID=UPI0030FEE5FE
MDSEPKNKVVVGVPAKTLSSQGYAICFFPEQPPRKIVDVPAQENEEVFKKTEVKKVEAETIPLGNVKYIRLHWRNRITYVIGFMAFTLSLNNAYHFPMNIYRYGGNFFIPYTVVTIFVGYPLHVLQTSMGQYSQRGVLWMWECAPFCCGVGVAMVLACFLVALYHNIFAAYALVYFAHCFHLVLPWTYCSEVEDADAHACAPPSWYISQNINLSSQEYFYNVVVDTNDKSHYLWSLGSIKWWLVLSLAFSWVVCYIAVLRSVRSIGKICIFIIILSYFTLLTLIIVALQLKQFGKFSEVLSGVKGYVSWWNFEMWCVATIQVIVELGLCYGIPITYASFCHFRNNYQTDSLILCSMNYLHSLIFFFIFFSFMVRYSCDTKDFLRRLPENTIEMVYIMYSEAFANLPGSQIWCMIFFLMLFFMLIGTQIAFLEAIMTAIYDNFVYLSKARPCINFLVCGGLALLSVVFCFSNGLYQAVFVGSFPIWITVLPLSILFVVGILFVYGLNQYFRDMNLIQKDRNNLKLKFFLFALLAVLIFALFIVTIVRPVNTLSGDQNYDFTHVVIMWFVYAVFIGVIIVFAFLWTMHCRVARKQVFGSSVSWMRFYNERAEARGQFSYEYVPSYVWGWNSH